MAKSLSELATEPGSFLKIYFTDGEIFANSSNSKLEIEDVSIKNCNNLLKELLGEEVTSSNIINRGDHLKTGGQYLRFVRLREFPQEIADQGHFNHLGNLLMAIRPITTSNASIKLEQKRRILHTNNSGKFANYRSEEGEEQAEELLAKIQLGEEALFEVEYWFWILTDSEIELQSKTRELLEYFRHHDGKVAIEDIGATEAFLNFVPGVVPSFINPTIVPSNCLLGFMPLSKDHLHNEGVEFHSVDDNPVYLDCFNGDNYNIAVVGHSGSGKSFLAQKIVDHYLRDGKKAVILDRGDSFKKMAEYHGGTFFEGRINPLQFKNESFLTEFLFSFIPHKEFSHKDKCLLFKLIKDNIKNVKNISDILSIIDDKIEGFSLYFEQYQKYFTKNNISIKDITHVDTREYPDSFLRPLFIYLAEYVKQLEGKKLFVFEECWHSLKHNIDYLGEFFRTSRAAGISCIAITQLLDDLTDSTLGRTIAENTYFKIIFPLNCKDNDYIDSDDEERIRSLTSKKGLYSEFYLKTPFHRKNLRYYPTPLEHEMFTSNFEDRKQMEKFFLNYKKYIGPKTIMHRWVELKHGKESINFDFHND